MDLRLRPHCGPPLPRASGKGIIVQIGTQSKWLENAKYRVHVRVEPEMDQKNPLGIDVFRKKPANLYKAYVDSQSFSFIELADAADYVAEYGFDIRLALAPKRSEAR